MTENYDLLPHDELKKIKQDITTLKSSLGESGAAQNLLESMDKMTNSMNAMLAIFKEASEEMKLDEHDAVLLEDKIDPLMQKIDKVLDQNEKIAKGIVAVADMAEEVLHHLRRGSVPRKRIQERSSPPSYYESSSVPAAPTTSRPIPPPAAPPHATLSPSHPPNPGRPLPQAKPPLKNPDKKPFFKFSFK